MTFTFFVAGSNRVDAECGGFAEHAAARCADQSRSSNELRTIPGGGHGNFKPEQRTMAYVKIREFLAKNGLMAQ